MFSEIFSPYEHVFGQHYLENKKPTLLACIFEQVYAVILKSSKNEYLYQDRQTYSARSLKSPWHGFCNNTALTKKQGQAKMEDTCCS